MRQLRAVEKNSVLILWAPPPCYSDCQENEYEKKNPFTHDPIVADFRIRGTSILRRILLI